MSRHGKILFKYGTMSSGKSLHLLATAHNFKDEQIPFIIFKSDIDNRDGEGIIHSRAFKEDMPCINISTDENIYEIVCMYVDNRFKYGTNIMPKWILVDEAQFLTTEQVEQLAAIADRFDINIICYGLRTDFKTQLFEGSKRLFEIADSIDEIKARCSCDDKSIFNARVNENGDIVTDGEQVEVGGNERYKALCRKCYFIKTNHPLYKQSNNDLE